MPIQAGAPFPAFRIFQDHLNWLLHRTITERPLILVGSQRDPEEATLYFREHGAAPIQAAVPVGSGGWYLALSQTVRVVPDGASGFILKTAKYRYAVQRDGSLTSEPVLRYEYVSEFSDPDLPYCRNHVHHHPDFNGIVEGVAPSELHLPTGWVTIEQIIRFLITELGVSPLSANWLDVVKESEEQFKNWTARDV